MTMRHVAALVAAITLIGCSREAPPPAARSRPRPSKSTRSRSPTSTPLQEILDNQSVGLCYGVENAKTVRLEPPVEQLKPGYNRCFYLTRPHHHLQAAGRGLRWQRGLAVRHRQGEALGGRAAVHGGQSGPVHVDLSSAPEVSRGEAVTLCYGAPNAVSVTMDPPLQELKPAARFCFQAKPERTTTYSFTATSKDKNMETATLTVKVR